MDAKTLVLDVLRDLGAREAAQLRAGAADMGGTSSRIIPVGLLAHPWPMRSRSGH